MMEASSDLETSVVFYQTTQRHNQKTAIFILTALRVLRDSKFKTEQKVSFSVFSLHLIPPLNLIPLLTFFTNTVLEVII
jgi:hypothetical protein